MAATYLSFNLLAGLAGISTIVYLYRKARRRTLPLPPGPRGYPIIGNVLDMPKTAVWEKYHEWCEQVGSDIVYLNLAGKNVIILDSHQAVTELLEKRSLFYSDRPRMPMACELVGFEFSLSFSPYGNQWRAQRRLMHQVFLPSSARNLHPHILKATHGLLRRFLERPGDVIGNVRQWSFSMAGATILAIAFGLEAEPDNDPYMDIAERGNHIAVLAATPGLFLVDSFPILKHVPEWMPGAGFKRKAREWKKMADDMLDVPSEAAKRRINSGNYVPSFISHCLSHIDAKENVAWQEYLIKGTAANLHGAGSDTIYATITNCIIAFLNHPDILKRAQAQVDSVVPFGELPTFEDEEKLPLITAICMETSRWRDVVPAGIPHMVSKDDVYKGYHIPKGSIIMANAWAMLHDEEVYPDSFSFNPDRFLKDGKIDKAVPDPSNVVFGFGRRACPGRLMALSSVWITVASLVAAFDILKALDEKGNEIDVDPEYNCETLLRMPTPFACSINPRSEKHRQTILATMGREYEYIS